MMAPSVKSVRCAIYTRVSTDRRSRHPKGPVRSCSRTTHLGKTFVRNSSSAEFDWSARSPEVTGGWMMSSQVG